jgi:hypothetical protein
MSKCWRAVIPLLATGSRLEISRSYTRPKMELLSVWVLSANDSCSIPRDRRMLRYTFDIRVSPLRQ